MVLGHELDQGGSKVPRASRSEMNGYQRRVAQSDVEFRVMPSGDGRWHCRTVIKRGTAETEPAACRQASEAAREAKLID
jgi:hypothetical protein